jgi:hypothetical protein
MALLLKNDPLWLQEEPPQLQRVASMSLHFSRTISMAPREPFKLWDESPYLW